MEPSANQVAEAAKRRTLRRELASRLEFCARKREFVELGRLWREEGSRCERDEAAATAMAECVKKADAQALEAILALGADPLAPTPDRGESLLAVAATYEFFDGLKMLLAAGGGQASAWGGDALERAVSNGHLGCVAALLDAGCDPRGGRCAESGRGVEGSPLAVAIACGQMEAARLLVERGALLGARGNPRAADCARLAKRARQHGHPDLAALIESSVERGALSTSAEPAKGPAPARLRM